MGVREAIVNSRFSRGAALAGTGAALVAGGVFIGPVASASAAPVVQSATVSATCSLAPDAKASSHLKRCGLSQINYGYKSSKVVGKKRCYYFLATAWNPCSTPVQYDAQACKAI
jgi:hypothetical protein